MASSDVDTWSEDDLSEYLERNQISDTDVQSVEELRMLVKVHIENSNHRHENDERDATERTVQASQAEGIKIGDILAKDQAKRLDLIQLYTEIQQFDHKFAESLNLQKQYPDRIKRIDDYICDLKNQTCPIVVAGEVGSGKSSLINLLICEEIFPSSHLPCTSAICKLQNSERRAMTVTFDDHTESHNLPDLKTLQDLMRIYAGHNRTSEQRKCKQINIFWPIPLLPENVVLVDVPGIGESFDMDAEVLKHISEALVCIYVVFSSNAGGVLKDKLNLILEHRIKSFDEKGVRNSFEHTLFVCNHWDEVKASGEEDQVWNNIRSALKCSIGDMKGENVVKISVKEAARNLNMGFLQAEYVKDLTKTRRRFNCLLLDSLSAKASHHYSILESMLNGTRNNLADRLRFEAFHGEEKTKLLTKIKGELEVIDAEADKSKQKILRYMEKAFKGIASEIHAYIHSKETKDRLLNCKEGKKEDDDLKQAINRVESVIQEWEEKEQRIAKVKKTVEEKVHKSIGQIRLMIENVDLTLESSYQDARRRQETSTSAQNLTEIIGGVGASFVFARTNHPAIAIGLGVGVLFFFLYNKRKEIIRRLRSCFQPKMYYYMNYILEEIVTAEKLSDDIMQTCYVPLKKSVDDSFDKHVLATTEAKKRQIQIIEEEKRCSQEIIEVIREAIDPLLQIVGRLNTFKLVYLFQDYINDDIIEPRSYLGSYVYTATIKFPDKSINIALKVLKRQLQPETVIEQMNELEKFRLLRHDNIVEYFGVYLYPGGAERSDIRTEGRGGETGDTSAVYQPSWMKAFGKTVAICLELCDETLEENAFRTFRIQNRLRINKKGSLSTCDIPHALVHYRRIILGVCSGLAYIHRKGFMHSDLKLSNVLIRNGVPKITDFGMSRVCDLSQNTMMRTHMSPEMLEQKEYSKPTDIYSMAILMWEFWYGQRSFTKESQKMSVNELTKAILEGLRPEITADVQQMPRQLHKIVVACWQVDPDKRPIATDLLEILRTCNIKLDQM